MGLLTLHSTPDATNEIHLAKYTPVSKIIVLSLGKFLDIAGHSKTVTSASCSPNGKKYSSASDDKTIRIWDSKTMMCIHILQGHTDPVLSVAYSNDGQQLVSVSWDGTIRIWEATPSLDEMLEATKRRYKHRRLTSEEKRYYLHKEQP